MADITLLNRSNIEYNTIGAIICRTPKMINDTIVNDYTTIDNRCVMITSISQLIAYFGDPFIDPVEYSDLIIAYNTVNNNIPVYISSVLDVKLHNDNFNTKYNGFTEFMFKDSDGYDTVGYDLKSDLKFCQPILQSDFSSNQLTIYASLFLLNRSALVDARSQSKIDYSKLYRTYSFSFDVEKSTDNDIISALSTIGLELKRVNCARDKDLINEFKKYTRLSIATESINTSLPVEDYFYCSCEECSHGDACICSDRPTDDSYEPFIVNQKNYWYNLHNNEYRYNLNDKDTIMESYEDAMNRISTKLNVPSLLCMSRLYKSFETFDDDSNVIQSGTLDLDPDYYILLQNKLMEIFDEDSDTYLFISTPDLPVSKIVQMMVNSGDFYNSDLLLSHFNCDLYHGFVSDILNNSLYYNSSVRVHYSVSSIVFFNLLRNNSLYLTNAVADFNISNEAIKSSIPMSSAEVLMNCRCNSVVLFDKGYPSIYGDRSLSILPNLRYSHISRYFVILRRNIKEYLETRKFTKNTIYSNDISINYIKTEFLDQLKSLRILDDYSIEYTSEFQSVYITITLWFVGVIESISLNFTI